MEKKENNRIIAFYLPQFYSFPENDEWWGKGFTEWTNVKKAKPLYSDHYQPTVPLNQNYYCLEDISVMKWQTDLAKEYGIYGFCFYHYWFGENRMLMQKPVENFLLHKEIDFPFCICWANHNWSRTWVGGDNEILMDVRYGKEEEWEKHFQYLLPYFKDKRYIRIDNKPVLVIYLPQRINCYKSMLSYFQKRALEEDLNGIVVISQHLFKSEDSELEKLIDYKIDYEPNCSLNKASNNPFESLLCCPSFFLDFYFYRLKGLIKKLSKGCLCKYRTYSYDAIWKYILNRKMNDEKTIAGAFVKCDVTPRRQERALIFKGATPAKFNNYLKLLIDKVNREYNKNLIFISAWNEWGEGMYLEPDEKDKYAYLEGVRDALK